MVSSQPTPFFLLLNGVAAAETIQNRLIKSGTDNKNIVFTIQNLT